MGGVESPSVYIGDTMNYKELCEKAGITEEEFFDTSLKGYEATHSFSVGQFRQDPDAIPIRGAVFKFDLSIGELGDKELGRDAILWQNANRRISKTETMEQARARLRNMAQPITILVKPAGVRIVGTPIERAAAEIDEMDFLRARAKAGKLSADFMKKMEDAGISIH